ncbi:MAG: serine/threonine protein kinase [Deltaproteobacteria bacterium]|nr:serine/threonine protein kinase [Deltaproteobacteria bacterium]
MGSATHERFVVGRYMVCEPIASGSIATVHLGRLLGPTGFSRTVLVKRLHARLSAQPAFTTVLLEEARLAARVRHPNVVSTLDVVEHEGEYLLVTEHVLGETLASLLAAVRRERVLMPLPILGSIMSGVLQALHAAHETADDSGQKLGIVHQDVSPHSILVGVDGMARIEDFGLAKASLRLRGSISELMTDKYAYMAPEQLTSSEVDRRADVFALSAVLWEALTGKRLFAGTNLADVTRAVRGAPIEPPSVESPELPAAIDAVVLCGLERDLTRRYPTANAMAIDVERAMPIATQRQVAEWMERLVGDSLRDRAQKLAEFESSSEALVVPAERSPSQAPLAQATARGPQVLLWIGVASIVLCTLVLVAWIAIPRHPVSSPEAAISGAGPAAPASATAPSRASASASSPASAEAESSEDLVFSTPAASVGSTKPSGSALGKHAGQDGGTPKRLYLRD